MKNAMSQIATLANHIFHNNAGISQSEAWKKAWAVYRLKQQLQQMTAVNFSFVKVSTGEVRKATGTLSSEVVPQTNGTGRPKPVGIVTYFDTDKNAWRSFRAETLVLAA